MSFETTDLRNDIISTGNIDFPFTFPIFTKADIGVSIDGIPSILDADFTVWSGTSLFDQLSISLLPTTGFIRFIIAPLPGARVTLYPIQPIEQKSIYTLSPFPFKRVERDFDKLAFICRMLAEKIRRALKFNVSSLNQDIEVDELIVGKVLAVGAGPKIVMMDKEGPPGIPGTPGPPGPPGAGAAPTVTDGVTSVILPLSILLGAGFTVDSPSSGVARIIYTPPTTDPVGTVKMFAGSVVPTGWLICDGAEISRITYATLLAVIGIAYGAGNGTTTFNLPDFKGRAPIGAGIGSGLTARSLGQKVGVESHTLATAEMPAHTHPITDPGHNHGGSSIGSHTHTVAAIILSDTPTAAGLFFGSGDPTGAQVTSATSGTTTVTTGTTGVTTQSVGGGVAHPNMQPSAVINFIIKT